MAGAPGTTNQLYKVESGTVTQLLDITDTDPDLSTISQIQCTSDGESVYFMDDGAYSSDIWMIGQGGGLPTKVVEDTEVTLEGSQGYNVEYFAISDDASVIAFSLTGYWLDEAINYKQELFVLTSVGLSQLTDDTENANKDYVHISGDGSTIVYNDGATWFSIQSDGSSQTELETAGFNFGGLDLTNDGTQMFYDDVAANGGRLTNTDDSQRLDLFPSWNVATITLAVTWEASISDDGNRVAFLFQYSTWPFKEAVYVGYLNDPDAVTGAPTIESIALDPAAMPRGDSEASVTVTAEISDPQGLADIVRTSTDELSEGLHGTWADMPVYFNHVVHDDGVSPDDLAGDGLFTTICSPGDMIDALDEVTVRVSAQDESNHVVFADVVLPVGE